MRISQIMLGKGFGGAERSFVDLTLELASRGHQVQAICHHLFSHRHLLEGVGHVEVELVKARGEWDFWTPRKIASLLKSFKSDVVHTHLKRAAWHGGRAAKIAFVPVVSKLHNYVELARYQHIDTLICTTLDQRRHVLEAGWDSDRAVVIPNFSRLKPVITAKQQLGAPLRILTYGRYVKKKGFDLLLQAFRRLVDEGFDAYLTIGGSGPEQSELEHLASQLGVDDRVKVGVWIDNVSDALDAADVFVLPSLDEPFGIVMLEAMARGVPIVSTRTKGPSEVLDASTAALVEVGSVNGLYEALLDIASNSAQASARASSALSRYRDGYYVDAVIPRIEDLYCKAVDR